MITVVAIFRFALVWLFAHSRPEMNAGLADAQWQTAVDRACRDMITRLAADTPAATLRG